MIVNEFVLIDIAARIIWLMLRKETVILTETLSISSIVLIVEQIFQLHNEGMYSRLFSYILVVFSLYLPKSSF